LLPPPPPVVVPVSALVELSFVPVATVVLSPEDEPPVGVAVWLAAVSLPAGGAASVAALATA
jgi:hypothetical protein